MKNQLNQFNWTWMLPLCWHAAGNWCALLYILDYKGRITVWLYIPFLLTALHTGVFDEDPCTRDQTVRDSACLFWINMLLRASLLFLQAVTSTPTILVPIRQAASTINPSSLSKWLLWRTEALKRCPRDRRGRKAGGRGRVTPPSHVSWLVMAGPLSTLHYAPALRQMEWSRIQLRQNKQVGSVRLRHSIVSITAQAKFYCNCNVIWKTHFRCLSMKDSTAHSRHEDIKHVSVGMRI